MKKYAIYITVGVIIIAVFLLPKFAFLDSKIIELEKQSDELFSSIIPKKVVTPEPLRIIANALSSKLTVSGVLKFTNEERVKFQEVPLKLNDQLNKAAEAKIDDMFKRQYFAHVSPSGLGASDFAKSGGYDYIVIGENLALGNFKDDQVLVKAWMDSPGHRENVLNKRYEDIGIAVRKGSFEGENHWLAVQIFGTPSSSCPVIDRSLKMQIDKDKALLDQMEIDLKKMREEIDSLPSKRGKDYTAKVNQYNSLVGEYNSLIKSIKDEVALYNIEVQKYNSCVEGE